MTPYQPGDLIAVRQGWLPTMHVGIIVHVYGKPLVYECTSRPRPACVRTGRPEPVGVQSHHPQSIITAGERVWHYPMKRPLYAHEEDRLLAAAEQCLGAGYDQFDGGGPIRWAARKLFAAERLGNWFSAEFVAHVWGQVGVLHAARLWTPRRLLRHARRHGIVGPGNLVA